jgi:spore germination protein
METARKDIAYTSIIGILLVAVAVVGCFYYIERSSGVDTDIPSKDESGDEDLVILPRADMDIEVVAALVWWDQDKGFESIKRNGSYITIVTPFWYELAENGEIRPFTGSGDEEILAFLEVNDIEVLPMVSNEFSRLPLADIISDNERMNAHITDIVSLAGTNDYDGISLNYENLDDTDRGRFSTFVAELYKELKANGKKLMVHVHAKTSEPGTWNGPQAQDWVEIGANSDAVKIMAYDYHWSTSEPGAIAPVTWVSEVLDYAVTVIPKQKIYLGMALYGYNWDGSGEAESMTYAEAVNAYQTREAAVSFDEVSQCPNFSYTDADDIGHTVWFENAASVRSKLELADSYGIGGISLFRLGDEDYGIYEAISEKFGT